MLNPSRRQLLATGGALVLASMPGVSFAEAMVPGAVPEWLFKRARRALDRHGDRIAQRDRIGIADFSAPSGRPRFHLVDLASGQSRTLLVAHGRGSDPEHSGWLERFSNEMGSQASSSGAYLTSQLYYGKHGQSRRLVGLDPSNSNAEERAVVIHGAWYVSRDIARDQGKIGRSEGCFAFDENDLSQVLDRLGPGRMIYADKLA